jgi:hypothetical protein
LLALTLAVRRAGPVPWALALLGAAYAVYLGTSHPGLAVGSVFAGGFILAAELAYLALEPVSIKDESSLVARRLGRALSTAFAAGILGGLLLEFSNVHVARGFEVEALGVIAAVATVGAVAWFAHSRG